MSASASTPCPDNHPLTVAFKKYEATDDFKNSKHWAMTVAPMIQAGDPDAERKRYSLMPVEQRERHILGSLWAAFSAGFAAAGGKISVD